MKLIYLFLSINFIYYTLNFLSLLSSSVNIHSLKEDHLNGKGFLINYKNNSYILTNAHVCEGLSNNIKVNSIIGSQIIKNIDYENFSSDLCVIKNKTKLSYYPYEIFQTIKFSAVSKKNSFASISNNNSLYFKKGSDYGKELIEFTSIQYPEKKYELEVFASSHQIKEGESGSPVFDYNMRFKGLVVGSFQGKEDKSFQGGFYLDLNQILSDLDTL